jgi:Uma2 family endonuclease
LPVDETGYHGAIMAAPASPSGAFLFTVADLERMCDSGVFDEDDRIELLDGQIFVKPRESPEHQVAVGRVHQALGEAFPWSNGFWIRLGTTTTVDEYSLPEPDLAVVRGPLDNYSKRHPRGDETLLTVEVSLATVYRDRGQKAAIYARAGCPVYWVLDLVRREILVHTGPRDDGTWAGIRSYRPGDDVPVPEVDGVVAVGDLLPEPPEA